MGNLLAAREQMIIGMLIVIPSLLFLFRVFKWSPAAVISGSRAQEK